MSRDAEWDLLSFPISFHLHQNRFRNSEIIAKTEKQV